MEVLGILNSLATSLNGNNRKFGELSHKSPSLPQETIKLDEKIEVTDKYLVIKRMIDENNKMYLSLSLNQYPSLSRFIW